MDSYPQNRQPPTAPRTPHSSSNSGAKKLSGVVELGLKLYDLGFNVVPVARDKRPLCSWSSTSRLDRGKLEELLPKASGIAVVGGTENPFKPMVLALVDVDRPEALESYPTLKQVVGSTVSWYTGPRCPKCSAKNLEVVEEGRRFRCGCGAEFSVEEAGRGLGALVLLPPEVAEDLGTVRAGAVEILVNNYQLVPPSQHPTGVRYSWARPLDLEAPNYGIYALTEAEAEVLLAELGVLKAPRPGVAEAPEVEARGRRLRELSTAEVNRVVELLREAYRPGVRQYLILYLSGWAAKAGVSPVSVARVLRTLYEETGDSDPIKTRASAIVYSYRKAGVDLEPYAAEFEKILGVRPYGLEREIGEEEVKGRSGLQEVLEDVLGEERALEVIREISDILGAASPWSDSIIEILDYEKQYYAIANLRKLIVARGKRSEGKLIYKERVFAGAPTEVVVYVNPLGGVTKYKIKWEFATRPRPLIIGPAMLEEIVGVLRAEGVVLNNRLASDIMAAVVEGFIRKGRATIKTEIESPGFYLVDNKIVSVGYEVREPSREELREALELLNEIATRWFSRVIDRFSTAVKWWLIAPFSFVVKQMGSYMPWLYQFGPTNTGKSTINLIGASLWGFVYPEVRGLQDQEVGGSSVDTPARLEYWLSRGTFPVSVKEPAAMLEKPEVVEMVKAAVENLMARGRYRGGVYTQVPALAPLSFTSNTYLPRDPSLFGKRFLVLSYTHSEVLNPDREEDRELMARFEAEVKPRLGGLAAVGRYVASRVVSSPEILKEASWLGHAWLAVAEKLLREAYTYAGLEPPSWLGLSYVVETMTEVFEDARERVRAYLVRRVNEEYSRLVGRLVVEKPEEGRYEYLPRAEASLRERARVVLDKGLLPWAIVRGDTVYITTAVLEELKDVVGDMSLKSLAELLGWVYVPKKSFKVGREVVSKSVIEVPVEDFLAFLAPEGTPEEPQA